VVTALATSCVVRPVNRRSAPPPIPARAADKAAAVVLFGTPAGWSAVKYGAGDIDVGPTYANTRAVGADALAQGDGAGHSLECSVPP